MSGFNASQMVAISSSSSSFNWAAAFEAVFLKHPEKKKCFASYFHIFSSILIDLPSHRLDYWLGWYVAQFVIFFSNYIAFSQCLICFETFFKDVSRSKNIFHQICVYPSCYLWLGKLRSTNGGGNYFQVMIICTSKHSKLVLLKHLCMNVFV